MSMHKDVVLKIQDYLKSVTVAGKEAVAYATIFGVLNNELTKLKDGEEYIEYMDVPGQVWANTLALLERVQMVGTEVQSYLDVMGKVQMAAQATNPPAPVVDDTATVDADTVANVNAATEEDGDL